MENQEKNRMGLSAHGLIQQEKLKSRSSCFLHVLNLRPSINLPSFFFLFNFCKKVWYYQKQDMTFSFLGCGIPDEYHIGYSHGISTMSRIYRHCLKHG
jgi:hypothetical protein